MDKVFTDNKRCFVCGPDNPDGLRLEFRMDGERGVAETTVTFPERFQGWETVVHGGLQATVLDEAMIKAAWARGLRSVTGEMTVRYVKPVRTGTAYLLRGRVTGRRGKITLAESELLGEGGEALARAKGKLFNVSV
jgi:acyl-coenzyme A thioesterase PaaI-like protein